MLRACEESEEKEIPSCRRAHVDIQEGYPEPAAHTGLNSLRPDLSYLW